MMATSKKSITALAKMVFPSGMRHTEGNIPEEEQFEFYRQYNLRASRLRHRGSPETLIALAQKQKSGEIS